MTKHFVKEQADKYLPLTEEMVMEKVPFLTRRIYEMLKAGFFDFIGRESAEACKKLTGLVWFMLALLPKWKKVFIFSWPGKAAKRDAMLGMCLMLHAAPDAAPPTKSLSGLIAWCKERWEKYGHRLEDWVAKVSTSTWQLDVDGGTMTYIPGEVRPYPSMETKRMDVLVVGKDLDFEDASKASLCSTSVPSSSRRSQIP